VQFFDQNFAKLHFSIFCMFIHCCKAHPTALSRKLFVVVLGIIRRIGRHFK
jgi:hypothetical protein